MIYRLAVFFLCVFSLNSDMPNSGIPKRIVARRAKFSPHRKLQGFASNYALEMCCRRALNPKISPSVKTLLNYYIRDRFSPHKPFVTITLSKSGSHLLNKALQKMTNLAPAWWFFADFRYAHESIGQFLWTHFCLSEEMENFLNANTCFKKIIGIRDLRDICVSTVHQIIKGDRPDEFFGDRNKWLAFKRMSFDDQLLYVIRQKEALAPWIRHKITEDGKMIGLATYVDLGMENGAEQALIYSLDPNNFVCKYEDLVGDQGGGSKQVQIQTVKALSQFIGLHLSDEKVRKIADSIYGDNSKNFHVGNTFRKGQIGRWKYAFKDIHKEEFKKHLGKYLIAFGYEKDDNW